MSVGRDRIATHRLVLAVILLLAGTLRFRALDWSDSAGPHPDERAVVSQTYDMLVRDDYRPTIHTWGHFGYYSTLFAYKGYLHLQHWLNGDAIPAEERLKSVSGPRVPHFRELVSGGDQVPLGVLSVLLIWLSVPALRRLKKFKRWRWIAAAGVVLLVSLLPAVKSAMLTPVQPNVVDVTYMGRFIAALASTLSVGLIFAIGARLYSIQVGLLGAAFLAVAVLPIQLAHFFAVDALQAFCVVLALWLASRLLTSAQAPTEAETPNLATEPSLELPREALAPAIPALYVALGVAIGMAMASKFSSAPLLALPLLVHLFVLHRLERSSHLVLHTSMFFSYLATMATWFVLQPWAWENPFMAFAQASNLPQLSSRWLHILFSQDYASQLAEQSRMIQAKAGGPWVQQFVDTTPFLTVTAQMVRWSLGWPLGLVCLGGFFWVCLRNLFRPRAAELLLLSWTGVSFLILGTFKATFPRYTAGVLPIICLFGAVWCLGARPEERPSPLAQGLRQRVGWVVAAIVFMSGLLYSVAYVRVLERPHAWTVASLWIYQNVPPIRADGAPTVIAHEEWDDTIPNGLPPHSTSTYGSVTMAPYHLDGVGKAQRLAERLSEADWICLPTTRLYSTILKVEDRYPVTSNYYRALFAGELGFTLRKTIRYPPELLGLRADDIEADESHYVYDHPKSVLFEKTQILGIDELARRILEPSAEAAALTRSQLLHWQAAPNERLLNIARDPYLERSVLERTEVEALLRASGSLDSEVDRFVQALADLPTSDGLPAPAVRDLLAEAPEVNRDELERLSVEIAAIESRPGYSIKNLERLGQRRDLLEEESRGRALQRLRHFTGGNLLPREAALRALDSFEHDKVRSAPAAPPSPAAGSKVTITRTEGGAIYELTQTTKWLLVIEILALAVLPLTLRMFAALPDAGFPLAKILGWVLGTYVVWLATNLHLATFSPALCWLSVGLLAACCWGPRFLRRSMSSLPDRRTIITTEILFLLSFAVFALIRAYNPEIFWGEKTMDFSLLNATLRGGDLPPYEPWFSGALLNYYYYGFVLVAYLTRLTGVPSGFAYNLAMALLPALTLVASFSLGRNLTKRIRWGLVTAVFVGLIGNLDPAFQLAGRVNTNIQTLFSDLVASHGPIVGRMLAAARVPISAVHTLFTDEGQRSMWDSYWATSRAIGPGMINEYPIWSWLFADLHAHVMVMPVSLLVLSTIYIVFRLVRENRGWAQAAAPACLLALLLGTLAGTNLWDFLTYATFFGLASAFALAFTQPRAAPESVAPQSAAPGLAGSVLFLLVWTPIWPLLGRLHPYWIGVFGDWWIGLLVGLALVGVSHRHHWTLEKLRGAGQSLWLLSRDVALPVGLVVAGSYLLFAHFHSGLDTSEGSLRINVDGNISAEHVLRHFGFFLLMTLLWVFSTLAKRWRTRSGRGSGLWTLIFLELGLVLALRWAELWPSAGGLSLFLLLMPPLLLTVYDCRDRPERQFTALLLFAGWGLAACSELFVLTDRMNTVFKLYHPAWMLLAVGSAAGAAIVWGERSHLLWSKEPRPGVGRWIRRPIAVAFCGAALLVFSITLICSYRGVAGIVTHNRKVSDKPTLDGVDFLRHTEEERELLSAMQWLNENTRGPEVLAEAFTNRGYDGSALVSKYTGLPTLLGWPHHTKQRGHSQEQLDRRRQDLERLYAGRTRDDVLFVTKSYDIRWIFVGDLERRTYSDPEERYGRMSGLLTPAFRSAGNRFVIWQVLSANPELDSRSGAAAQADRRFLSSLR